MSPFLVPAVGAAVLSLRIHREAPAILVDAQLRAASILCLSRPRDGPRRGPVTQIVCAVAHRDRVVAKPGLRVDAKACRRRDRKLSFARVFRVLAKVLILR